MGKISIICPECRRQLSFMEVSGYQDKIVECPVCHFKAKVSVYLSGNSSRGAHGADDVPTELVMPPKSSYDVGQIRVKTTNEVQWLKEGSNVIGRRAKSGNADIKISNDEYMSRRNVQIDVIKRPHGYEHRLVEINSTNPVKLNGKNVGKGDILIIKYGDVITLGTTDILLEANDDDATRLA